MYEVKNKSWHKSASINQPITLLNELYLFIMYLFIFQISGAYRIRLAQKSEGAQFEWA